MNKNLVNILMALLLLSSSVCHAQLKLSDTTKGENIFPLVVQGDKNTQIVYDEDDFEVVRKVIELFSKDKIVFICSA